MVFAFTLTSNTSSRKAVAWLQENEIQFTERKMTRNPMTYEELLAILRATENGVDDILSKNSVAWKHLAREGVDPEEMTLRELHYYIERYPAILKAPILLSEGIDGHPGKLTVGFAEDRVGHYIPRTKRTAAFNKALVQTRKMENALLPELVEEEEEHEEEVLA